MSAENPLNSAAMADLRRLHTKLVSGRRTQSLAALLAGKLGPGSRVIDVGCGDGTIAMLITDQRPDVRIQGLEVAARPRCSIEYQLFDGINIPLPDDSFDVCMFVDVLHHTADPRPVLEEAARVSRKYVLIKEHLSENTLDFWTLKFMDWMGNRPHGVAMTYNYKSRAQWTEIFTSCGLRVCDWNENVRIHAFPLNLLFGRGLHVIALLEKIPPSSLSSEFLRQRTPRS
jgi:ubiquinone/menaquinone biosynthesis C-methylase UbiE